MQPHLAPIHVSRSNSHLSSAGRDNQARDGLFSRRRFPVRARITWGRQRLRLRRQRTPSGWFRSLRSLQVFPSVPCSLDRQGRRRWAGIPARSGVAVGLSGPYSPLGLSVVALARWESLTNSCILAVVLLAPLVDAGGRVALLLTGLAEPLLSFTLLEWRVVMDWRHARCTPGGSSRLLKPWTASWRVAASPLSPGGLCAHCALRALTRCLRKRVDDSGAPVGFT